MGKAAKARAAPASAGQAPKKPKQTKLSLAAEKAETQNEMQEVTAENKEAVNKRLLSALSYKSKDDDDDTMAAKKIALENYKAANPEQRFQAMQNYLRNKNAVQKWTWLGSWTQTVAESRKDVVERFEDWMTPCSS